MEKAIFGGILAIAYSEHGTAATRYNMIVAFRTLPLRISHPRLPECIELAGPTTCVGLAEQTTRFGLAEPATCVGLAEQTTRVGLAEPATCV
ncbi:hypothetical protein LSAT2_030510, partial [Lamellibrachia satsuma]